MKAKTVLLIVLIVQLIGCKSPSFEIDSANAYLGKVPPGNIPEIFLSNSHARLNISDDGKTIYYSSAENENYENVRYYRFFNDKWNGPFVLFDGYFAPAFSKDGDTLITMKYNTWYSYYSFKEDSIWGEPELIGKSELYYLSQTSSGNFYCGAEIRGGIGKWDIYKVDINNGDINYENIGRPINTTNNDVEFFISKDESYMVVGANEGGPGGRDLYISYRKKDKTWTNPKSLGSKINNSSDFKWAPYVTSDNKYLFYSSEPYPLRIYWVDFDNLLDSLRHTNFIPYVKSPLKDTIVIRESMFTFQVPDTTFFDDDGNNTISYSATLADGSPLPDWLIFSSINEVVTLRGLPIAKDSLPIKITATDSNDDSVSDVFHIIVKDAY